MKKILNASAIILLLSAGIPNVLPIEITQKQEKIDIQEIRRRQLAVHQIRQEQNDYCLAASTQAIFSYFNINIGPDGFTQNRIFNDLLQQNPEGQGIRISQLVADYMAMHIINSGTILSYDYNDLGHNFGASVSEARLFQNYVWESLEHNQPLIFGYTMINNSTGHAISIIGIEMDTQNPWATRYICMDPLYDQPISFTGDELALYTSSFGAIIGFGQIFDEGRLENATSIGITDHEIDRNDLNDAELHEVLEFILDVEATTGIHTTNQFRDTFSAISLANFNGAIYTFNSQKTVTNFKIDTRRMGDDSSFWLSPIIEMGWSSEDVGWAHIEGRIATQVTFEREHTLNHLIMTLVIYVSGRSWSTQAWAHVAFTTGSILSFIKK